MATQRTPIEELDDILDGKLELHLPPPPPKTVKAPFKQLPARTSTKLATPKNITHRRLWPNDLQESFLVPFGRVWLKRELSIYTAEQNSPAKLYPDGQYYIWQLPDGGYCWTDTKINLPEGLVEVAFWLPKTRNWFRRRTKTTSSNV